MNRQNLGSLGKLLNFVNQENTFRFCPAGFQITFMGIHLYQMVSVQKVGFDRSILSEFDRPMDASFGIGTRRGDTGAAGRLCSPTRAGHANRQRQNRNQNQPDRRDDRNRSNIICDDDQLLQD